MFRMFEPAAAVASGEPAAATVSTGVNPVEEEEVHVEPVVEQVAEAVPVKEGKKGRGKKDVPTPPPPAPVAPEPATDSEPVVEATPEPQPSPESESSMIMDAVVVLIEDSTGEVASDSLAENRALHFIGEQLSELAEEIVAEKEEDTGPKSYADLFKRNKAANEAPTPAAATNNKKARSGSGGRTRAEPAVPKAPKAEAAAPKPAQAVQGSSLYVKQLPADITVADLLGVFPGASKADINASKGFGFIEFPEPVFAASTMTRYQEDPSVFSIKGQQLKVEERMATKGSGPKNNNQRGPRSEKTAENTGQAAGKQNKQSGNTAARKNNAKAADKGEKGEKGWNYKK